MTAPQHDIKVRAMQASGALLRSGKLFKAVFSSRPSPICAASIGVRFMMWRPGFVVAGRVTVP